VAFYRFGDKDDKKAIGSPVLFYLFQGGRIARFNSRLSLNYEWNFGLSAGWHPYDLLENPSNGVVGSKVNAYINAGIYLHWAFARHFDLVVGGDVTHFSNGNTKFPNAGVNTTGAKLGVVYNFNRTDDDLSPASHAHLPHRFPRHISYDLVLFGSWRRKGVYVEEGKQVASPNAYPVAGFNFAPMYNVGYRFRLGLSADGVFDGSANVYTREPDPEIVPLRNDHLSHHRGDEYYEYEEPSSDRTFYRPAFHRQLGLGLSGRVEYVMPYFTINAGMGYNVLGGGDLRGWYQVLALKIAVTRNTFLHIGYNLQNFKAPNYLMLGLGYRFHNKYPRVRH
jgi:hypothetical protein